LEKGPRNKLGGEAQRDEEKENWIKNINLDSRWLRVNPEEPEEQPFLIG